MMLPHGRSSPTAWDSNPPTPMTPCSAGGIGLCYLTGTGTASLPQEQCWCDDPGSRQGHLKVNPAGASPSEAGGAMLSHRAAPTHAKVLCMPWGWTLATGPVMDVTQKDPAMVQGQDFPRKNRGNEGLSFYLCCLLGVPSVPEQKERPAGARPTAPPPCVGPSEPRAQLRSARQGSLNANFISEPLALFQEPAASEPFSVLHM